MDDLREKAISGIKCCEPYLMQCEKKNCPYYKIVGCIDALHTDVLTLLKAQKPKVMTLEEAIKADVCFVEIRGAEPSPAFVTKVKYSWLNDAVYRIQYADTHFHHDIKSYGKYIRFWTAWPTDEQREMTPWET